MKTLALGAASLWSGQALWRGGALREVADPRSRTPSWPLEPLPERAAAVSRPSELAAGGGAGKTVDFERDYPDDIFIEPARWPLLRSAAARFERVRNTVGYGHFNLLGFHEAVAVAGRFPAVGAFPRAELELLEELFWTEATRYGFQGEKVLTELAARIERREVRKIAGSGHYLLRGPAMAQFQRIRRDLGDSLVLTSGVRALAKQFQLFLAKAVAVGGNLSRASRSLAPPGYSFHAAGDFDVGKAGFGVGNFEQAFCETDEYRRLIDLGYVSIRYFQSNPFGVRFEPWHIKVT